MLCPMFFFFFSYYTSYLCLFLVFGFWAGCRSRSSGLGLHPYNYNKGFELVPICLFLLSFPFFVLLHLDPCLYAQIQVLAFLVLFPFMGLCLLAFCASLFVGLHPFPFCNLLGCNHVVRVYLHDVGLLAACLSLSCLALHVRVSHVSLVFAL